MCVWGGVPRSIGAGACSIHLTLRGGACVFARRARLSPMCLAAWSYCLVFLAFRPALALLPRVWFLAARVLVCWRCRDIYVVT